MASSAPPAAAEFQALTDEMKRLGQQGVARVGLAVAQQRAEALLNALKAQAVAGGGAPAAVAGALRAKDKHWDQMGDREKEAARTLGWTERTWDRGSTRPMDDTPWTDLPNHKRAAAELLGYRQGVWDNKGVEPEEEDDPEYRCGRIHFEETGRTVPYLLVPRSAALTTDEGMDTLFNHMHSFFGLEDNWGHIVIRIR